MTKSLNASTPSKRREDHESEIHGIIWKATNSMVAIAERKENTQIAVITDPISAVVTNVLSTELMKEIIMISNKN